MQAVHCTHNPWQRDVLCHLNLNPGSLKVGERTIWHRDRSAEPFGTPQRQPNLGPCHGHVRIVLQGPPFEGGRVPKIRSIVTEKIPTSTPMFISASVCSILHDGITVSICRNSIRVPCKPSCCTRASLGICLRLPALGAVLS